ncbi:MAG: hypothetical protein MR616_07825, partial [Pyramidobacter sp.]|nr:hypothetical protein [Pyramidobacter sp.]
YIDIWCNQQDSVSGQDKWCRLPLTALSFCASRQSRKQQSKVLPPSLHENEIPAVYHSDTQAVIQILDRKY